MPNRLLQFVAWTTLAQVALVGGLGTGLHGLLGCEHGRCASGCCVESKAPVEGCHDCSLCRHAALKQQDAASLHASHHTSDNAAIEAACCDDCALCDLLAQYHSATPIALEAHSIELASGEAALLQQNAIVAAAIRLAPSRGPPAA